MKISDKVKMILLVSILCILVAVLFGFCMSLISNTSIHVNSSTNKPTSVSTDSSNAIATSGILFEVTDNNLISGLYYELDQSEAKQLQDLGITSNAGAYDNSLQENAKYILDLYDGAGMEIATYAVMKNGDIYSGQNRLVQNSEFNSYLKQIIQRETDKMKR